MKNRAVRSNSSNRQLPRVLTDTCDVVLCLFGKRRSVRLLIDLQGTANSKRLHLTKSTGGHQNRRLVDNRGSTGTGRNWSHAWPVDASHAIVIRQELRSTRKGEHRARFSLLRV